MPRPLETPMAANVLVGAGVVMGLIVGKWGYEHLFVEGIEDDTRRKLVGVAAGTAALYGLFYLLDVDFKYATFEGASEWIEQKVK